MKKMDKEYYREYYKKNKAHYKKKQKEWAEANKEAIAERKRQRELANPEATKKWRQQNYLKNRIKKLTKRYNITIEEYELMLAKQEGKCAICGLPSEKTLHVDHDHKTGRFRGLLCTCCNFGLGYFKDRVESLIRALEYLKQAPKDNENGPTT